MRGSWTTGLTISVEVPPLFKVVLGCYYPLEPAATGLEYGENISWFNGFGTPEDDYRLIDTVAYLDCFV